MGTNDQPKIDQGEEFKWDSESTVIKQVEAVAVYSNPHGDLVIRQQHHLGDEDAVIVVPMARANDIADAIKREIKRAKT